jgi:hypothetical protein
VDTHAVPRCPGISVFPCVRRISGSRGQAKCIEKTRVLKVCERLSERDTAVGHFVCSVVAITAFVFMNGAVKGVQDYGYN